MKIQKITLHLKIYIFGVIILTLLGCKRIDSLELTLVHSNQKILFLNQDRVKGIIALFEYSHADTLGVEATTTKSDIRSKVVVEIKNDMNTAILYLHTGGAQSTNANDFIGVFMDRLPGGTLANAAYKYGSVKAWTHPVVFSTIDEMPKEDIQFMLWKYADGVYGAAIPLGGNGYMGALGKEGNKWGVKLYSKKKGHSADSVPAMALGFGKNAYETVKNVYKAGLTAMGKTASLRENKTYPQMFEKLAWCTWNSFGHQLSEELIFKAMQEFESKGVKFPLVLLDDGWSTVTEYGYGKLEDFTPQLHKFPHGLKYVIDTLKGKYGVNEVGVWHAFNGYWAGLSQNPVWNQRYGNDLFIYNDVVGWQPQGYNQFTFVNPHSESGKKFYTDWYEYLKKEGVTFVKVDNQLIADRVATGCGTFYETAQAMQNNMQTAVKKYFNGHVINCMDMTTDAVYHFGESPIARASEDFFPENHTYKITAGNAAIHVLCNVHNSLWWSQMVWPDFDMFQTHHPDAEYHAVARALSGGPIYFADSVGKTNKEILNKLSLPDGTILRADVPALPTEDCMFNVLTDKPLKMFTYSNGCGLLAAFHAHDGEQIYGTFSPADLPDIKGKNLAVYNYKNNTVVKAGSKDVFPVQLNRMEWQLYYVKPIEWKFASFGIADKYNAPKTVKTETITDKMALIETLTHGTYIAYCAKKIKKVVGTQEKPLDYSLADGLLTVNLPENENKIAIMFE